MSDQTADVGEPQQAKPLRGFAKLKAEDPARFRDIASRGGKRAQALGEVHRFTSEEARSAGRKGGIAARDKRLAAQTAGAR